MKKMLFVGAAILTIAELLVPSVMSAEAGPYSELAMPEPEVLEKAKELGADTAGYWRLYGEKMVERKSEQVLAWSVDLVDQPRQGEMKICRTRIVRWLNRTQFCKREGCISKDSGTVKSELYAASLLPEKLSCENLRYPDEFFLTEATIGDEELSVVVEVVLNFQGGPNGCRKITDISRSSAKPATFDVSTTCKKGSGWGDGTAMEIEVSEGAGKVVANRPLSK